MDLLIWIGIGALVLVVLGVVVFFLTVRQAADHESQDWGRDVVPSQSVSQVPDLEADVIYEVRQLMDEGKKIEAIKLVRTATNMDLKAAKAYVESLDSTLVTSSFAREIRPVVPTDEALSSATLEEVQMLVAQGQKIMAIKKVREFTVWGLKEAKDYVDVIPPLGQLSSRPTTPYHPIVDVDIASMDDAVRNLLAQNKKIDAVKLVRKMTGWGLKESKEHVDALQRQGF